MQIDAFASHHSYTFLTDCDHSSAYFAHILFDFFITFALFHTLTKLAKQAY